MKRFLLTLVCCSPLLFSPSSSFSLDLIGPNDDQAVSYEQYGPISSNETLWRIATKLRPNSSVSIQQTLVAIYKINPYAFYEGNINKIIPESIIMVPEPEFIRAQTDQEAIALINAYSPPKRLRKVVQKKQPVVPVKEPNKEKPQAVVPVEEPNKEKPQPAPIIETAALEASVPLAENPVEKKESTAPENEFTILRHEFDVVSEQLLVTTEKNQSLKQKLQSSYDQNGALKEQIENELLSHEKLQNIVNDYRSQLDAVKERPFSGEGLLNEILRLITASLTNLLIAMISPVLLLLVIFVVIMRLNSKRALAEQEQEFAESTVILMEESGKFDSLLTEDIAKDPEVDFTADEALVQNMTQTEAVTLPDEPEIIDELEGIDLTDAVLTTSEEVALQSDEDDPFGIGVLAEDAPLETDIKQFEATEDDPFGITALAEEAPLEATEDDPFGIGALAEEAPLEATEDDPFGIGALAEEGPLEATEEDPFAIGALAEEDLIASDTLDYSTSVSDAEQADLDLAAASVEENVVDSNGEHDTLAGQEFDLSELGSADIDVIDLTTAAEDKTEVELDIPEQTAAIDLAEVESDDLQVAELDTSLQEPDLKGAEAAASIIPDENEQLGSLLDEFSELESEEIEHDEQALLAKQLSEVAFNADSPLPKVNPAETNDFIDIETLLENSDAETKEEPYSELDLDLGLDEFPDVINTEESVDIDDDENGVGAQLDLARAYLEIDDKAGAKQILLSVVEDSNGAQRGEIEKLLSRLA